MIMKRLISNFLILILSIISILLVGEIVFRIYAKFQYNVPFIFSHAVKQEDSEFGWPGKKIFGDRDSNKYKIFFIGDSFTHGLGISEDKMYYNLIKDKLSIEVFIYGGAGYGTLQEYMVLDKYFDQLKPDLIIIQLCTNDFVNNLWELENASLFNINYMVRPYLINGEIVYRCPFNMGEGRLLLLAHSKLVYSIFVEIAKLELMLAKMGFLYTVEQDINKRGLEFDDFRKSVSVTKSLFLKIKNRTGKTPVVFFLEHDAQPYLDAFRRICSDNNIELIDSLPEALRKAEDSGAHVWLNKPKGDFHWGVAGHQICADVLIEELTKKGYIK